MSTTVLLLRHGENDYAGHTLIGWTPGIHLNDEGKRQAEQLVERLGRLPISAIYSSPLERAQETVTPLSARLGLHVEICEGLGEIRLGQWTGCKVRDLENDPLWQKFNRTRSTTRIPGGEMMIEVQTRMVEAFEMMRTRNPDSLVVAASHGDPIRAILMHALGTPLDFVHRIEVQTASVSVLVLNEWGPMVLRMNDRGELP